jgi:hypothetical protein
MPSHQTYQNCSFRSFVYFLIDKKSKMAVLASDWPGHFITYSPELLHVKPAHLPEMFLYKSSRGVVFQSDSNPT